MSLYTIEIVVNLQAEDLSEASAQADQICDTMVESAVVADSEWVEISPAIVE